MRIFKIKLINLSYVSLENLNSFLKEDKIKFIESNEKFDIVMFNDFIDFKDLILYNDKKKIYISGENLYNKISIFHIINRLSKKFNILRNLLLGFFLNFGIKNFALPFYIYRKSLNYIKKSNNSILIFSNVIERNPVNILGGFIYNYNSLLEIDKKLGNNRKKKFCAFIVSNPSNLDRLIFYKKLSKYKKIDSYGQIFKNCEVPKKIMEKHKNNFNALNQEIYKDYKFVICFENSYSENYITEKIINPMVSNSIPIYRGASNVSDYFNTKSFINYDDYGSYDKMIEKIIELDKDDKKYEEFVNKKFLKEDFFEKLDEEREKLCLELLK